MRARIASAVLVAALTGQAIAADGNDLIKWCQDINSDTSVAKSSFGSGYCMGTMSTVYTLANYINSGVSIKMCPPSTMTNEQMARIVVKYLQQNPEVLHLDAATLTFSALRTAYPCK